MCRKALIWRHQVNSKLKITGLILGGYLLGRTKKLGLALIVASAVAGSTAVKNRDQLLCGLKDVVDSSPELKELQTKLTGRLAESGKSAAKAMAAKGVDLLSNTLQHQTERMKSSLDDVSDDLDPHVEEAEDPEGSTPGESEDSTDIDAELTPEAEDTTATSSDGETRAEDDTDAPEAGSDESGEAAETVDEEQLKKPARKKSSGTQRKQNIRSSSARKRSTTRKPKETTDE